MINDDIRIVGQDPPARLITGLSRGVFRDGNPTTDFSHVVKPASQR